MFMPASPMFLLGLLRLQDRTRTEAAAISLTAGVHFFFDGLLVFMLVIQVNTPGDTAATVISSWKQAQEAKVEYLSFLCEFSIPIYPP